jgi:hypothetical protein
MSMDGIVGFLIAPVVIMVVALQAQTLRLKKGLRVTSGGAPKSGMPNRGF